MRYTEDEYGNIIDENGCMVFEEDEHGELVPAKIYHKEISKALGAEFRADSIKLAFSELVDDFFANGGGHFTLSGNLHYNDPLGTDVFVCRIKEKE